MGHNSPETIARFAARAGGAPLIGQGRPLTDAEKEKYQRDEENATVLKAVQQEQQERDQLVRIMLSHEDFDLERFLESPEAGAKQLLDAAALVVAEANRRDYAEILAELKRVGDPVRRDLRLICERHGLEVESAPKLQAVGGDGGAPG